MSTTNEPLLSDNKLNWTDVSGSRHQMAGWQVREIYEAQRTADRALIQALVDALAVLSASAGMGANLIPDDELKRLMRDGDSTTRLMAEGFLLTRAALSRAKEEAGIKPSEK